MSDFRRFNGTPNYLTNDALEAAVNCALVLERPLLVKGEPGTGKTLLAEAVAETVGLPLIHWPVKSTTRADHGLYLTPADIKKVKGIGEALYEKIKDDISVE